ncbi:MAG: spore germination protein GerW family protein [Gammaproteobacteria bacterium]|jgi:uncharacterized spore protein YtfJ|nr:spore germination protein GerW family protein [Gammaproteobacteria bacterium]
MAVEDLIQTVLEELRNIAQTEVHVGKPMEVGNAHVIPVSKISMGFGAGGIGGEGEHGQGRGTGGGVSVEPVAFLVVREDDVQLLHLQAPGSPIGQLMELIPDIIDQLKERLDNE